MTSMEEKHEGEAWRRIMKDKHEGQA